MNRSKYKFLLNLLPRVSLFARVDPHSFVGRKSVVYRFARLLHSSISDYSYVAPYSELYFTQVGRYCSIGKGVKVGFASHPLNRISTSPVFYSPSNAVRVSYTKNSTYTEYTNTVIGSDVWLGAYSFVAQGIKIGHGAVVAAHAVVTRDVPPYAIVGGVPAKIIRYRFSPEIIESLIKSNWWNQDEAWFRRHADLFSGKLTESNLASLRAVL